MNKIVVLCILIHVYIVSCSYDCPMIDNGATVKFHLQNYDNTATEIIIGQNDDLIQNIDTKILVHGWKHNISTDYLHDMTNEYKKKGSFNIIIFDWDQISSDPTYVFAAHQVNTVGYLLGDFIVKLHLSGRLNIIYVHLIGHSLGAHICGNAGKYIKSQIEDSVNRITGLDPAGPFFDFDLINCGFGPTDAKFVDCIGTNMHAYGMNECPGQINFYPNGGSYQPGCLAEQLVCSHLRAYMYFNESINNNGFLAKSLTGILDKSYTAIMGENLDFANTKPGNYYLDTNCTSPFALYDKPKSMCV